MDYVSTFSGIGGFDLGLDRAGMNCVAQVEIDKHCNSVLARHWPGVERHTDVSGYSRRPDQRFDLLCGGSPCQDVSVAGNRAGLAGARSGLFFQYARILDESRPAWFVFENVPGLLNSHGGGDFETVLGAFSSIGYGWAYRILDAQYFGLAQRRKRVFIVGYLGDARRAAEVLFEQKGVCWDPPSRGESRTGVADRPAACLNSGGNAGGFRSEPGEHLVAYGGNNTQGPIDVSTACNARGGVGRLDFESETFVVGPLCAHQARHGHAMTTQQAAEHGQLTAMPVKSGGNLRHDESHETYISGHRGVRRLMPIECERLQGFPDHWTRYAADGSEISDSQRYRMLGNAVAVPVAEWIAKRIMRMEMDGR